MLACPGYRLRGSDARRRALAQLGKLRDDRLERQGLVQRQSGEAAEAFGLVPVGETDEAVSDLMDLPGAGAGLVWMLGQHDIHSQADLAQADIEVVARQLGPVGKMINLRAWVECVRRAH